MNELDFNKKRKKICIISIIFTILIVLSYVLEVIFLAPKFFFVSIIGAIVMLFLLYCLSHFYVYKEYLKLKINYIFYIMNNKINCQSISLINIKNEYLYHFFDKSKLNVKNAYSFNYNNKVVTYYEFENLEKRFIKLDIVTMSGRLIVMDYKSANNFSLVLNYDSLTERFNNYFNYYFKNNDNNYLLKKKKYTLFYNDKNINIEFDFLNDLNGFNSIYVNDNKLYLLFLTNKEIFEFKLQKEIDYKIKNKCIECYDDTFKIINKLNEEG